MEILKVRAEIEKDKAKKAKIEEVYRAVEAPKLTKSGVPAKSKSEKWNASDFNAIVYNFGITSEFKSVPDNAENTATDAILAVRTYRAMNQMRTYLRTIMDNFDMPGPGIVTFRDIQAHFFTCMLSLLLLRILQIRIQEKSGFAISIKQIVETLDEAELAVLVLKKGMMPKFVFFDKPHFGQVAGWLSVPYETSCLLREAGVAGRSPLVDVMEAVDIPLSETAFDVSGLAILFGTKFKTLQDAIPEPYFSYLKGKKTKELPDDFLW